MYFTTLTNLELNDCLQIHTVVGISARINCWLSKLHGVKVNETELHTGEILVSKSSSFRAQDGYNKKVKRYKSPGVDNIPAGFIHAGGRKIHSEIHKTYYRIFWPITRALSIQKISKIVKNEHARYMLERFPTDNARVICTKKKGIGKYGIMY
jgi:hypothetical protein